MGVTAAWVLLLIVGVRTAAAQGIDADNLLADLFANLAAPVTSVLPWASRPLAAERQPALLVIGCGLSRTGTVSLARALETIGTYKVFHTRDLIRFNLLPAYAEAVRSGANGSDSGVDALVDSILALGFNASTDPALGLFTPRLAKRFPRARFIVTQRDSSLWTRSLNHTLDARLGLRQLPWRRLVDLAPLDDALDAAYGFRASFRSCRSEGTLWYYVPWLDPCLERGPALSIPFDELRARHRRRIENAVEPERRLHFNPRQAWQPLCDFLGWPAPSGRVAFPFGNDAAALSSLDVLASFVAVTWPVLLGLWALLLSVGVPWVLR